MMGREVRMVPPDWQHPKDEQGEFIPLLSGDPAQELVEWEADKANWERGLRPSYTDPKHYHMTWEEYAGPRVFDPSIYMPQWTPEQQATHYMMYETCSEGTPISPAFATTEELARWLADTGASAFGGMTASYEDWLRCARGRPAPAAAIIDGRWISGVELQ